MSDKRDGVQVIPPQADLEHAWHLPHRIEGGDQAIHHPYCEWIGTDIRATKLNSPLGGFAVRGDSAMNTLLYPGLPGRGRKSLLNLEQLSSRVTQDCPAVGFRYR